MTATYYILNWSQIHHGCSLTYTFVKYDPAFQIFPTHWINFHEAPPSVPNWPQMSPCLVYMSVALQNQERTAMTQGRILTWKTGTKTESVTRVSHPKFRCREPHTAESATTAQQQGSRETMTENHKSRSPLQARRKIKEPMGKKKHNKNSLKKPKATTHTHIK